MTDTRINPFEQERNPRDVELMVAVLAAAVVTGLVLWARAAGRRGNHGKSKTLEYLAGAVTEAVFVGTAVLMWRHVLADGSHLFEAVAITVLAVTGLLAIVVDALMSRLGPRRPASSTPAPGNGRARDLTRH